MITGTIFLLGIGAMYLMHRKIEKVKNEAKSMLEDSEKRYEEAIRFNLAARKILNESKKH